MVGGGLLCPVVCPFASLLGAQVKYQNTRIRESENTRIRESENTRIGFGRCLDALWCAIWRVYSVPGVPNRWDTGIHGIHGMHWGAGVLFFRHFLRSSVIVSSCSG